MYGADGYNILNDTSSYPSYAQVSVSGQSSYTWASSTSDARALEKASAPGDRLASCWYSSTNFTIDVNLTDGNSHQVALYAIDWDGSNVRQERFEVLDASTNAVLDTRDVSSYSNGKYLVWVLRGHVKIKLTHLSPAGYSAVVSGLFFDAEVPRTNVARAADGAVASASSTLDSGRTALAANNGDRQGQHWGSDPATGSGWHDATNASYPDWLQVDFDGSKTIDEVDVFSVQDNVSSPSEPTATMTFSQYGITDFQVQYWNGAAWTDVSGGNVTGNNLVWRKFTFTQITTAKIRVLVNSSSASYSRVVELEAWGTGVGSGGGGTVANINWLVTDQLGTPRMVFDQTGSLATMKRHDYLPFGEELSAGTGGRTTAQGYGADNIRQKFTLKERDNETGLDWFDSRYYSSAQGRFTGPDSYGGRLVNPQTLNLYAYVRNNPLKYVDPTGHFGQEPNQDPNRPHPNKPCSAESPCEPDDEGIVRTYTDQKKGDPTKDLAEDILGGLNRARQVSNSLILGPYGARASDYTVHALGATQRVSNRIIYGPLAGYIESILSDPRVQLGLLVIPELDVDDVIEEQTLTFDQARVKAFENAGMTEASEVKFTKVDPETGTVVEFKGEGGAKVVYDGPHPEPGPAHDVPHVGWQTAGKRSAGATRGNIPYRGAQHPSRSSVKGRGVVDPH